MRAALCSVILSYDSISKGRFSAKNLAESLHGADGVAPRQCLAPLPEVVVGLTEHRPLPERAVALTFDDGFCDFYTSAAPVLARLAIPATVFLPMGCCGRTNCWRGQPGWVPTEALLDWRQVVVRQRLEVSALASIAWVRGGDGK